MIMMMVAPKIHSQAAPDSKKINLFLVEMVKPHFFLRSKSFFGKRKCKKLQPRR